MPPNRPYNVVSKKPPVQKQLDTIWNYLTETQQVMNRNMQLFTPQALSRQIVNIVDKADDFNPHSAKVPYDKRVYAALKSNIIKTADIIVRDSQTFSQTLASSEAFQSEFGKLLSVATLQIDGSAVGIRQLYTWHETLKSDYGNYVTNSQQYIKDGLLDYDGASPIYGIEVGLISEKIKYIDEDGKEVTVAVKNPIKTRITASEWSLWRNDTKICYTNANNIYFPSAHITGGSIEIGEHFTVDNSGNLTATSGKIAGWRITSPSIRNAFYDSTNKITRDIFLQATSVDTNSAFAVRKASGNHASDPSSLSSTSWDYIFQVTNEGKLIANDAEIKGKITATSGSIAGWNISPTSLIKKDSDGNGIGLSVSPYISSGTNVLAIGDISDNSNWSTANFRVAKDGTLHATGAVISGKITATSGTIGGWTINSNRLQGGTASDSTCVLVNASSYSSFAFAAGSSSASSFGDAPFRVSHAGKLYASNAEITGKITANSGNIGGWKITSSTLEKTHEDGALFYLAGSNSYENWMVAKDSSGSITFRVHRDGTLHATGAVISGKITATSGKIGDCTITNGGIRTKSWGSSYYSEIGNSGLRCFFTESNGDTHSVDLTPLALRFGKDSGSSEAIKVATKTSRLRIIWSKGIQIGTAGTDNLLTGTWAYSSGSGSLSDRNYKNSIDNLSKAYSILFDNLKARIYKYNNGTSGRIHIGFIAQEVSEAIENAGLSSQDAALVMEMDSCDENGSLTGQKTMFLRYEEIIALLVNELQVTKKQLAELQQAVGFSL